MELPMRVAPCYLSTRHNISTDFSVISAPLVPALYLYLLINGPFSHTERKWEKERDVKVLFIWYLPVLEVFLYSGDLSLLPLMHYVSISSLYAIVERPRALGIAISSLKRLNKIYMINRLAMSCNYYVSASNGCLIIDATCHFQPQRLVARCYLCNS